MLDGIPREPGNPWVIAGRAPGTRLASLTAEWYRIRARAGLGDVRIHDLRHTFASRALALGESLPTIARLLGHARVQTTSRYAHLARDTVREAAARVAADIGGDILPGPPGGNSAPSRPVPDPAADGRARGALRASAERIAACIGADIRG